MLNSLTPPTDNLYKFAAIFGLVLTLGGATLFGFMVDRYVESGVAVNQNLRELQVSLAGNEAGQQAVSHAMQEITEGQAANSLTADLQAAQVDEETLRRAVNLQKVADQFVFDHALGKQGMTMAAWLIGIGLGVSSLGFGGWYFRLQRYEDKVVRQKAEGEGRRRPRPKKSGSIEGARPISIRRRTKSVPASGQSSSR